MALSPVDPALFCADLSRELGEPLIGTATHAKTWFLLEYPFIWNAHATEDNELPATAQAWLDSLLAATPGSRLQFIRRISGAAGLSFFVVTSDDVTPHLYRFDLASYEALPELNLRPALAGEPAAAPVEEPLYLVCTNGRRDRCCALYGVVVAQALAEQAGEAVWQTTHLGGHRFAPTVLTLPDGMMYGRMHPEEAGALVAAHRRDRVLLSRLRGRASYEGSEQAAEILLREQTGETGIGSYRLSAVSSRDAVDYNVRFAKVDTGDVYDVLVRREPHRLPVYAGCGKPQEKPLYQYRLLSCRKQ